MGGHDPEEDEGDEDAEDAGDEDDEEELVFEEGWGRGELRLDLVVHSEYYNAHADSRINRRIAL